MGKVVVVALGGNALVKRGETVTIASQARHVREAMQCLLPLIRKGYRVVLTHGNAPQVGSILIRVEEALGKAYTLPLEVCVAESEGEMGYLIEQSLQNVLLEHRVKRPVVSVLTQVIVDGKDPAFRKPTKPIGPWYAKKHADVLKRKGLAMVYEVSRGWRRVVPSPKPVRIDDVNVIKTLMKAGVIVIAAGGGGIPVVKERGRLKGVAAVIDKDWASACLAKDVGADTLLIVTGVRKVALGYGTPRQQEVSRLTVKDAKQYLKAGEFPPGSMGPKIEAAIDFLEHGGKTVIITCPSCVLKALAGTEGTRITR